MAGPAVGLSVLAASSVVVVVLAAAPSLVVELVVPVSVEEVAVAAALVVALAVVTAVALVAVGASDGETFPSVQALPSQHPSPAVEHVPGPVVGQVHPSWGLCEDALGRVVDNVGHLGEAAEGLAALRLQLVQVPLRLDEVGKVGPVHINRSVGGDNRQ